MEPLDLVFKALADPSRRLLLDRLNRRNGQSLLELCAGLEFTRQAVTKHLAVLEAAGLVTALRRGRVRLHYLNAAPIQAITDRWLSQYDRARARALADLKHALENAPMSSTAFVYVTYIHTTPERLWQALTDRAWITRYFNGGGPESDWQVGSAITWRMDTNDVPHDWGQRVLDVEPYRRLTYSWHNYQPEMARMFGWSDERLAGLREEPISKVSFQIEPMGEVVKLTVVHDDFVPDSEMRRGISEGWPMILSFLKTLLETTPVTAATPA